ncbi:hypothetical protein IKO50_05030 [bacterium]|nr:hypothetical protein [bacterium]MBQ5944955.1 hypothetical protein [bacterium]MBR4634277.1 hypothetical protein [bacterium]
MECSAMSSKYL